MTTVVVVGWAYGPVSSRLASIYFVKYKSKEKLNRTYSICCIIVIYRSDII